jgi:8-oxo-dGTP pyrophosphatase MutT (NUDIX family)
MQVVYAQQPFPEAWSSALFLAGPTPRAHNPAPSWRPQALEILARRGYRGVVFVPESADGQPLPDYDAQVEWETEGLHLADVIVFWVPRELERMPAFTTNVEFGRWLDSLKCALGHPPRAPKMKYLDTHYEQVMGCPPHQTLEDTLDDALARVGGGAWREGGQRSVPLHLWQTPMFQAWHEQQVRAGNRLQRARVCWAFRAPAGEILASVVRAEIWVGAEGRSKDNEWLLSRPDLCSVVLHHRPPGAALLDTELVLIREYRAPSRTTDGFVHELAGGSGEGEPPAEVAAREVAEETGLQIAPRRLAGLGSRQVSGVVSSHHAHLFAVELTRQELEHARALALRGERRGLADESERTCVEVTTLREVLEHRLVDWATLGMLCQALLLFAPEIGPTRNA